MKTKIVNLCPHSIVLRTPEGEDVTISPSGTVARVSATPGALEEAGDLPVPVAGVTVFGEVTDLPGPVPGTVYIVSGLVGSRVVDRNDVFVPGTGPRDGAIRDDNNRIVAVTRLNRV